MPNSLLLTLLTEDPANKVSIIHGNQPKIPPDAKANITEVFQAINPDSPRPNLKKDVARKELYEALYSIIEKEYDDSGKDQANLILNKAIAMALETAIRETSQREKEAKLCPEDGPIIALRTALRSKIISALTPKPLPA